MNQIVVTTQVYIRKSGKTLMLKRVAKKENDEMEGKMVAVGGRMELGETIEESATREVKEETGLDVHRLIFRGVISYVIRRNILEEAKTCLAYVFECNDFSGSLLLECTEGKLFWIDEDDIYNHSLLENDKISLEWIFENEKIFVGEFITDELGEKKCNVKFR